MSLADNRFQFNDVLYQDESVIAYRALDKRMNRTVVVETVAPGAESDVAIQLMRKAQQAAHMPHVAALFNQYTENNQPFLVWEDVTGQSVAELAPLPSSQAAEIVGVVAETAQAALRQRVPLPPLLANNVYLGPGDQVHITNLGLHQGAATQAQATVALGFLLNELLDDAATPTALHTLASQAMASQIPTVDGFMASLRRLRQQSVAPTVTLPRPAAQTVDLNARADTVDLQSSISHEPMEQAINSPPAAPAPRQKAYSATPAVTPRSSPTGAQRRIPPVLPPRPTAATRRRSGLGWVWVLPVVALLGALAFFVLPRLAAFVNGDNTATADVALSATAATERPVASAPASAVAAAPSASVAPSTSAAPSASASPSSPSPSPSPSGARYVVASTTGQNLRVRQGPGTSTPVVASLPNGTPVDVVGTGQAQDGYTWVPIRAGDVEGWSILEGLAQQSGAASPAPSTSAAPSAPASATPAPSASPSPSSSAVPVPSGAGAPYVVATINGQQLVVRSAPGGDRVTSLPNGTVVSVTGAAQAGWLPIRVGEVAGWVIAGGIRPQ